MSLLALPVVFDCALTFFVLTNNVDLETSDEKQIPNGYLREQIRHRHGAKLHQSSRHLIEMSKFMVKKNKFIPIPRNFLGKKMKCVNCKPCFYTSKDTFKKKCSYEIKTWFSKHAIFAKSHSIPSLYIKASMTSSSLLELEACDEPTSATNMHRMHRLRKVNKTESFAPGNFPDIDSFKWLPISCMQHVSTQIWKGFQLYCRSPPGLFEALFQVRICSLTTNKQFHACVSSQSTIATPTIFRSAVTQSFLSIKKIRCWFQPIWK